MIRSHWHRKACVRLCVCVYIYVCECVCVLGVNAGWFVGLKQQCRLRKASRVYRVILSVYGCTSSPKSNHSPGGFSLACPPASSPTQRWSFFISVIASLPYTASAAKSPQLHYCGDSVYMRRCVYVYVCDHQRISPTGDRSEQFMTLDTYRERFCETHLDYKNGNGKQHSERQWLK